MPRNPAQAGLLLGIHSFSLAEMALLHGRQINRFLSLSISDHPEIKSAIRATMILSISLKSCE